MTNSRKLKVINLFGPPGVGKSTVRAGVFWLMKTKGYSVEEVHEYAKYMVLTGQAWRLAEEQLAMLADQNHQQILAERNGYEYAVSDSPLQLCSFYAPAGYLAGEFEKTAESAACRFDNINFLLTRDTSECSNGFENRGRVHTQEQSRELEHTLRSYLVSKGIAFFELKISDRTPWDIVEKLPS